MGSSLFLLDGITDYDGKFEEFDNTIVTIEGLCVGLPMTYRYLQQGGKEIYGIKQSDVVEKIHDCGKFRDIYTNNSIYHFKYI